MSPAKSKFQIYWFFLLSEEYCLQDIDYHELLGREVSGI